MSMLPTIQDRKFWHATAVLVGTMVGVGIFGVPFAFAKAGFFVGVAWLVALSFVVYLFNALFAELTVATSGTHQLSGYAGIWLGPWGKRVMTLVNVLSLYGALLAFLIVAGEFLHNVLSNFITVDPQWYVVAFAFLWSLVWFGRILSMAMLELILIGVYISIIGGISVLGVPHIHWGNFVGWISDFWHLPYGVLLFALAGMSAIPIQRQLLTGRENLMRPAIATAIIIVATLYLVFAFVVVGVSGDVTSPESLSGLFGFLGEPIIILGSLFGILTISTSYVMLGTALFETFSIDYHLRPIAAWMLAVVPPTFFYLSGLRNFIDVIDLVGAVAVGMIGILLLAAYLRAKKTSLLQRAWIGALIVLFAAGVVYQFLV